MISVKGVSWVYFLLFSMSYCVPKNAILTETYGIEFD